MMKFTIFYCKMATFSTILIEVFWILKPFFQKRFKPPEARILPASPINCNLYHNYSPNRKKSQAIYEGFRKFPTGSINNAIDEAMAKMRLFKILRPQSLVF
jgi:hypothetical protein